MNYTTFSNLNITNLRLMIREDFNVPINEAGEITSDARIQAALPTIKMAIEKKARIILLSHLGQPKAGEALAKYSLKPVAKKLSELLNQPVRFIENWLETPFNVLPGEVVLCENVRFNDGEKTNDPVLSQKIADLCDIYAMDAFATAHRKHASTYGALKFAKKACAGPLLISEIIALEKATQNPKRPVVAIVGGSKVSSKLTLLQSLVKQVDFLILGGGIANNFIAAKAFNIGKSLYEPELMEATKEILSEGKDKIIFPEDVITAKSFDENAKSSVKKIDSVLENDQILDVGPKTVEKISALLSDAGTILWNGPLGVFEWESFSKGTKGLAEAVAKSSAYSIAGGGDTLAAIEKFNVEQDISYISTGGGAFLTYLENNTLPVMDLLKKND